MKERNLKSTQKTGEYPQRIYNQNSSDSSIAIIKAKRQWLDIVNMLKENNRQLRI